MADDKEFLPPHAAESFRHIEAVPGQADAMRLEGLEGLQLLRSAKSSILEREHTRLTQKYGASHPRVAELSAQITTNRALVRHVSAEAGRARVAQVDADPKSWILHGRVMNRKLQGEPELTVALYDAKGTWIQALGYACTDKSGYFRLVNSGGPSRDQADIAAPPLVHLPAGAALEVAAAAARTSVFIHVLDSKSSTLHRDTRELNPALGAVDYVEIILDADKPGDCTPPDGTRPPRPDVMRPTPSQPDPTKPDSTRPVDEKPEPAKADTTKPPAGTTEPVKAGTTGTASDKPEPTKADTTKPAADKPDPTKVDSSKSGGDKVEPVKGETKPAGGRPGTDKPRP